MTDILRVATAGNVDDGKSTLIGRLLVEAEGVHTDVLAGIRQASKDFPGGLDYSLVTDGLAAEREQKITIDVAYRYFGTPRRRFILADSPGHEQYTRNMATAASLADVAIILVDVSRLLSRQAMRHATVSALLGISQAVVAVNKMDLVGFDQTDFERIRSAFHDFSATLGFGAVHYVPVSALLGDNVTRRSSQMPWYTGATLLDILESIEIVPPLRKAFRLAVQMVIRSEDGFRGYAGTIASGDIHVGDAIVVAANGQTARVASIRTPKGTPSAAMCGDSVVLGLDREIDIGRGDLLCADGEAPNATRLMEADLVWFSSRNLSIGRELALKTICGWNKARVVRIGHRLDVETLSRSEAESLAMNDIGRVTLQLRRPISGDTYRESSTLGSFILVDQDNYETAAAGMVVAAGDLPDRESLAARSAHRTEASLGIPKTILFTGLSGAGKSTLAKRLCELLMARHISATWIDGDDFRRGLSSDLGYSSADRHENLRRMAEVAKLFNRAGTHALCSFIAPLESYRVMTRAIVGAERYVEVFVDAPLEVCRSRDPKGWYERAGRGDVRQFTGLDAPYEVPKNPDLILHTGKLSIEECCEEVLRLLLDLDEGSRDG